MSEHLVVDTGAGAIEVEVIGGRGRPVVMVPSLGRSVSDFDELARAIADAGHLAVLPEVRGLRGSSSPVEGTSLVDLAADVAAVVHALDLGPATVIGHAFGNRVARCVAASFPDAIAGLVLLACGGKVPPAPAHAQALRDVFDGSLDDAAHLEAVRLAFFAPGNDASVWRDGWHPDVARHQVAALGLTDVDEWWPAGSADVLVVQPADDVIALAANSEDLMAVLGDRGTLVTIAGAGHALLPERPEAVARAVLDWLAHRA